MFHCWFSMGAAQTTSWFRSCLSQTGPKPSLSFAKVRFSPYAHAQARIAASAGSHGQTRICVGNPMDAARQHASLAQVQPYVREGMQADAILQRSVHASAALRFHAETCGRSRMCIHSPTCVCSFILLSIRSFTHRRTMSFMGRAHTNCSLVKHFRVLRHLTSYL